MTKEKIILTILGIIPLALALGAFWYATVLGMQMQYMDAADNAGMKGFLGMGVIIVGFIGVSMLYSAYKILAYARNR